MGCWQLEDSCVTRCICKGKAGGAADFKVTAPRVNSESCFLLNLIPVTLAVRQRKKLINFIFDQLKKSRLNIFSPDQLGTTCPKEPN